jgi:hypothetical protein
VLSVVDVGVLVMDVIVVSVLRLVDVRLSVLPALVVDVRVLRAIFDGCESTRHPKPLLIATADECVRALTTHFW